jgi:hypothetical protein
MRKRGAPRLAILHRGRRNLARVPSSRTERILQNLGAHPAFADSVLGDLAEERAQVATLHGAAAAQWWYVRESLRSAPHLLWNAVQYGGPHGRARVPAMLLAVALVPMVVLATHLLSDGPPARLVIGTGDVTADLIVNSRRPMQVSTLVFDAAGHALPPTGVRYRWASGVPVAVTPAGIVTCTQPGDASIRASLGAVATTALLRCRPVRDVRAPNVLNLVVGWPSQDVPYEALGPDGRPVTLLAGAMSVGDSAIVTLEGQRIRARAAGTTRVTTQIGDGEGDMVVHSYERASSPEAIRLGQHLAVPVRLAGGEMHSWRLPASSGRYFVTMVPDRAERSMPHVAITGANCEPWFDAHSFLCAAPRGASVFVYVPPSAGPALPLSGTLAVWREQWP